MFLLSPASLGGERARVVLRPEAQLSLARRLQQPGGAPLGEVFAFLSGLYFRGKLAYAAAFARPPAGGPGALVITANRGLLPPDAPVTADDLRAMAAGQIDLRDPAYSGPLARDAHRLRRAIGAGQVVLLGSIATEKYATILGAELGPRLLFPAEFVGRGDMSRGGLLLRCARAGIELDYVALAGAVRHGPRPPRLPRAPRAP